jgi:hypothetical protein
MQNKCYYPGGWKNFPLRVPVTEHAGFSIKRILPEKCAFKRRDKGKAKNTPRLSLSSLDEKASRLTVSINCGQHALYHSKGYNRRGDHSWARMEPASLYRIQHKSPCTFVVGYAHDSLNHYPRCGELYGNQDSDRADSLGPFAGRTLVLRQ